jgi:hypothetical protein
LVVILWLEDGREAEEREQPRAEGIMVEQRRKVLSRVIGFLERRWCFGSLSLSENLFGGS